MVIRAVSSRRDRLDRIRLTPQNEAGWANVQLASTFNAVIAGNAGNAGNKITIGSGLRVG